MNSSAICKKLWMASIDTIVMCAIYRAIGGNCLNVRFTRSHTLFHWEWFAVVQDFIIRHSKSKFWNCELLKQSLWSECKRRGEPKTRIYLDKNAEETDDAYLSRRVTDTTYFVNVSMIVSIYLWPFFVFERLLFPSYTLKATSLKLMPIKIGSNSALGMGEIRRNYEHTSH